MSNNGINNGSQDGDHHGGTQENLTASNLVAFQDNKAKGPMTEGNLPQGTVCGSGTNE